MTSKITTDLATYLTDLKTGPSLTGFVPQDLTVLIEMDEPAFNRYSAAEKSESTARRAAFEAGELAS
jgi:hypothetical protein